MLKNVSLTEAINLTLQNITPTTITTRKFIYNSLNEILAEDIIATRNSPVFTNSAMDGFAFKHSSNKKLKIIGKVFAGDKNVNILLKDNECVKIMTGAPLPKGADTVIPFEKCISITENYIKIPKINKGANVRNKGEEYKKGEILIKKGTIITPEVIATLVSQGITNIKIYKKPNIAILSTGNELKEPWENTDKEEIYNTNSHSIKMLLQKYGFEAEILGIMPDNLEKTIDFISQIKKFDVIITSGGISFGEKDYIHKAFKENNLKEIFYGIRLKPGHPTMVGKMNNTYVFALPGNPLSSYLNAFMLLIPALRKLTNALNINHTIIPAINKKPFKLNPKKSHLVLGTYKEGFFKAYNSYKYGSAMLSALLHSNAIAVIEEGNKEIKEEKIKIILI